MDVVKIKAFKNIRKRLKKTQSAVVEAMRIVDEHTEEYEFLDSMMVELDLMLEESFFSIQQEGE